MLPKEFIVTFIMGTLNSPALIGTWLPSPGHNVRLHVYIRANVCVHVHARVRDGFHCSYLIPYEDIPMAQWTSLKFSISTAAFDCRLLLTLTTPGCHVVVKLVFQDGLLAQWTLLELVSGSTLRQPMFGQPRYFNHLQKIHRWSVTFRL